MTVKTAAEALNCNSKDIEVMIRGMTKVADMEDGGKLVNLKGIEDFLRKMQVIINQLLAPAIPVSSPESKVWIKGRKAAKILSLPYDVFVNLCKEEKIQAGRKARGWRVEEDKLNEFIKSNQDLIKSLRGKPETTKRATKLLPRPAPVQEPADHLSDVNPIPDNTVNRKEQDDPPPVITEEPQPTPKDTEEENSPPVAEEVVPDSKSDTVPPQKQTRYCTVRARKHNGGNYCRIDDVATGLSMPEARIKKWINDHQVKAVQEIERSRVIWYIEKESLKTFLETYNIMVTFDIH
ncbi:MAG: hypothetical protein WA092_03095 [Minisyncoccales bacterium]